MSLGGLGVYVSNLYAVIKKLMGYQHNSPKHGHQVDIQYLHMIVKCMSMNEWVAFFLMVHALKMRIIIIRSHAACIVFFFTK